MRTKGAWAAGALIVALALAGCGNNEIDHSIQTGTSDTSQPGTGESRVGSGTGDGTGTGATATATGDN